jgi:murein DD-endopeptidase MepM/ murein hydrolase activator NlpD
VRLFKSKLFLLFIGIFVIGFLIPESKIIPVKGATSKDWNTQTFWYEPWGSSGVHKGIDIFSQKDQAVIASSNQMILYKGSFSKGGNVILALGAKWQLHYYAHLSEISEHSGRLVSAGTEIGKVGNTGNAAGKQPHLHYSIVSVVPRPWLIDGASQGYKKAFYMNPIRYFNE